MAPGLLDTALVPQTYNKASDTESMRSTGSDNQWKVANGIELAM